VLLSQGLGFDNHNPLRQDAFPLNPYSTPATAGSFNLEASVRSREAVAWGRPGGAISLKPD